MTYAEIVQEIRQLSEEERLGLIQALMAELYIDTGVNAPVIEAPPILSLVGVLNPEGKEYTDEDIDSILTSYLRQKYL